MGDPLEGFRRPVDAELAAITEQVDAVLASRKPLHESSIDEIRAQTADPATIVRLDGPRDDTIPGPAGPIPVRIYQPDDVDGVHLLFHGGGWVSGRHDGRDRQLTDLAAGARVTIVSVGYRLAPEHPYPAAPDDCEAAACWLAEHAGARFGTDRITIGGESAGAHLTAVTLVRLRDRHGFTGFRGAELRFGLYDMRMTPSVRQGSGSVLGPEAIAHIRAMFVPDGVDRDDPDVSPLFASLHDLPPAIFTCGTADTLIDDTLFMWARWRAAGNDAELRIVPGAMHAFDVLPIACARKAMDEIARFLAACVREG